MGGRLSINAAYTSQLVFFYATGDGKSHGRCNWPGE